MNILARFLSALLWLFVAGTLIVAAARKFIQTNPKPEKIRMLNANEAYQFRKAR